MLLEGVTSVGHLMHPPPDLTAGSALDRMHSALRTCWSTLLWAPGPPPTGWYQNTRFANRFLHARPDSDRPGQLAWSSLTILPDSRVQELSFCPLLPPLPLLRALVINFDPYRSWRSGHKPTVGLSSGQYFLGEHFFCPRSCSWGFGKRLCTQLVVRKAADRLTTLTATKRQLIPQPAPPSQPHQAGRSSKKTTGKPQNSTLGA